MIMTIVTHRLPRLARPALLFAGALLLAGCEAPPPAVDQTGYRGTGMEQVYNPPREAALREANKAPEPQPPVEPEGPPVSQLTDTYKNIQVLGDLREGQFLRLMTAMSEWVAPQEGDNAGCAYCHNLENMADGSKYQYTVARRMLQMTKTINNKWASHVGQTGVTCYTCHRGQPVPQYSWVTQPAPTGAMYAGWRPEGQNHANPASGYSSLPADPFTTLLREPDTIRVIGKGIHRPEEEGRSIRATERTYGLMMHMSTALGVNCTFCHNSRGFSSWETSTPQRVTSWHGLRMVPDINATYVEPLGVLYPRERRGVNNDAAKVYCTTCHQGVNKPLYGAQMLKDYLVELNAANPAWQPTLPPMPQAALTK
jgi:photosynthetic reaction center cytochrome c subunit